MTSKAKKLLITTEKHEFFIVRLGSQETVRAFCPTCETEVEMLTLDSAVRVSAISGREVIDRIASNEFHAIETANGHLLICKSSLSGRESAEATGDSQAVGSGYKTEDDENV